MLHNALSASFITFLVADNFKLPAEIRLLVRRVVQAVVVRLV